MRSPEYKNFSTNEWPGKIEIDPEVEKVVEFINAPGKPSLDDLRRIEARIKADTSLTSSLGRIEPVEEVSCSHREWVDGDLYSCRLLAGHKGKCLMGERIAL